MAPHSASKQRPKAHLLASPVMSQHGSASKRPQPWYEHVAPSPGPFRLEVSTEIFAYFYSSITQAYFLHFFLVSLAKRNQERPERALKISTVCFVAPLVQPGIIRGHLLGSKEAMRVEGLGPHIPVACTLLSNLKLVLLVPDRRVAPPDTPAQPESRPQDSLPCPKANLRRLERLLPRAERRIHRNQLGEVPAIAKSRSVSSFIANVSLPKCIVRAAIAATVATRTNSNQSGPRR